MLSALSQAVANELRFPLAERCSAAPWTRSSTWPPRSSSRPTRSSDFHDRLQRATERGGGQSSAVVFGLVTLMSTLVVAVGVIAVLFTVAPRARPDRRPRLPPHRRRQRPQQPGPLPDRARADGAAAGPRVPRVRDDRPNRGEGDPFVRRWRPTLPAVACRTLGHANATAARTRPSAADADLGRLVRHDQRYLWRRSRSR